jgi:hypothetical protein
MNRLHVDILQRRNQGRQMREGVNETFSNHRPSGPMLSISWFVRLCVCLSVRLFIFEVPFNCLFAPTSWSRMSKIFRDSESLGKSNGKKWSNIWTFLFGSVFFADFALVHPPMASVLLSASVERCFVSRMRDFLEASKSWRASKLLHWFKTYSDFGEQGNLT